MQKLTVDGIKIEFQLPAVQNFQFKLVFKLRDLSQQVNCRIRLNKTGMDRFQDCCKV